MKGKNVRNGALLSKLLCLLLALAPVTAACGDDTGRDLRTEREQKEEKKKEDSDKEPTKKEEPEEEDEPRTEPEVTEAADKPEPTEVAEPTEAPEATLAEEPEPQIITGSTEAALMSFTTQDVDGNQMTLGDLVRKNDLTMLNVWGTFCGPCINEMPGLQACADKYADRGFGIVGLTCDLTDWDGNVDPSMVAEAKDIARSTGVKYPLVVETEEMMEIFETGYVPTTFFVDKSGNILNAEPMIGSLSEAEWQKIIEGYLSQVGR